MSARCFIRSWQLGPPADAPDLPRKWARYLGGAAHAAARATLSIAPVDPAVAPRRRGIFTATGAARYDGAVLGERLSSAGALAGGAAWSGTLDQLDPFALLKLMSCNLLAVLSMALDAEGRSAHFCDDALGGLAALDEAQRAVGEGALDWAIVVAWDDFSSPHARAELAASGLALPASQLAVIALSAAPGPVELCEVALRHDGGGGPIGGGAGLELVAEALGALDGPSLLALEVDRGGARVSLRPVRAAIEGAP